MRKYYLKMFNQFSQFDKFKTSAKKTDYGLHLQNFVTEYLPLIVHERTRGSLSISEEMFDSYKTLFAILLHPKYQYDVPGMNNFLIK